MAWTIDGYNINFSLSKQILSMNLTLGYEYVLFAWQMRH
jgi:hypothetical protein